MKPFASVGKFLIILFALGVTVGAFLIPARAGTPSGRSNLAAAPPGLIAAVARGEAAATAHAPRYRLDARGCTRLPAPAPEACFGVHGARIDDGAHPLALTLTGWGRAGAIRRVHLVRAAPQGNRIEYRGQHISESWQALPLGFEQTFVLAQPPTGLARAGGQIILQLRANRAPRRIGNSLAWGRLRYGGLAVRDAAGHAIPAVLSAHGRIITLSIRAAHARWPITVDPLVWLQQEVTAKDGAGGDWFGRSVALSGTTAMVGAPHHKVGTNVEQGAAYVYTESGGTWSRQAELVAGDGAAYDFFGFSVALSSSGTTAVIDAPWKTINSNADQGAAYVFTESGGTWSQQAELTAANGAAYDKFGYVVALSGTTAAVGAPYKTVGGNPWQGAAYVFTESGGTWSQQAELAASDGAANDQFGSSVALSGTTAVIGAYGKTINGNASQGAAYVYTESGGTWSQQAEWTAAPGAASDWFGSSVALSGTTAVVGASGHNAEQGAAYVYTESGGTWSQQAELTASDGAAGDYFGYSIALSSSGTTAVIGASGVNADQGAAYVFTESGGTWSRQTKWTPAPGAASDYFGSSVALSGTTAVVGALGHTVSGNTYQGAAYFYSPSNLANVLNAPASVLPNAQFTSEYILTNSSATASAAAVAYLPVPSAASYVGASASQGSCTYDSTALAATCKLGAIAGNGGTASASLTLKATAPAGSIITENAEVNNITPSLSATATISGASTSSPPTMNGLTDVTVHKGQSGTETFTIGGTGELFVIAATMNTPQLSVDITGAANCNFAGSCTLTLTPGTGQTGTALVAIDVADLYGQSTSGSFNFTVTSGGGGGSLGFLGLLALLGLTVPVILRRRHPRG